MKKIKFLISLIIILISLSLSFILGYLYNNYKKESSISGVAIEGDFEDSLEIIKSSSPLEEKIKAYLQIIEKSGPGRAQDILLKSGLPFDGDAHLLNHSVGDYLYEKYKDEGLIYCKDYFLSSCYHGFVLHAVADGGFDTLKKVMDTCWKKGTHVAIQCSHAIGHGFLTYDGYANLTKALEDCDNLAEQSKDFPLFNCHDGIFMENIWAVHEDGKPSKERWVKDNDPIYPCNDPRIDYKYINACWSDQPMRLYQIFSGDLKKAGEVCNQITDSQHKQTCFDGLARQIHPLTKGSLQETFNMCSLMPKDWINPCVISISKAFFSVGDHNTPFAICNRIPDSYDQGRCFWELADAIPLFITSSTDRKKYCNQIPEQQSRDKCLKLSS